jgi:hypothetical protein
MNYRDQLEQIIRGCYPVLTIISNKETHVPDVADGTARRGRKKSSNGLAATGTSRTSPRRRDAVHGGASRKNCPALVGSTVK